MSEPIEVDLVEATTRFNSTPLFITYVALQPYNHLNSRLVTAPGLTHTLYHIHGSFSTVLSTVSLIVVAPFRLSMWFQPFHHQNACTFRSSFDGATGGEGDRYRDSDRQSQTTRPIQCHQITGCACDTAKQSQGQAVRRRRKRRVQSHGVSRLGAAAGQCNPESTH